MVSKLYKLALWYIEKCNNKWNKHSYGDKLKSLRRLTYWNFGKYMLNYGADAEWRIFSRYEVLDNAIQKLAKYEDYEGQGLLLQLPCKVGTNIFIINHYWIDEGYICGLAECDDVDCACFKVYEDPDTYTMVAFNEFGQTWFLTKEEAEQKLKDNVSL